MTNDTRSLSMFVFIHIWDKEDKCFVIYHNSIIHRNSRSIPICRHLNHLFALYPYPSITGKLSLSVNYMVIACSNNLTMLCFTRFSSHKIVTVPTGRDGLKSDRINHGNSVSYLVRIISWLDFFMIRQGCKYSCSIWFCPPSFNAFLYRCKSKLGTSSNFATILIVILNVKAWKNMTSLIQTSKEYNTASHIVWLDMITIFPLRYANGLRFVVFWYGLQQADFTYRWLIARLW